MKKVNNKQILLGLFCSLTFSGMMLGADIDTPKASTSSESATLTDVDAQVKTTGEGPRLDLTTVMVAARYRWAGTQPAARDVSELQHKEKVEGAFKFDQEGRYSINFSLSSGYYFSRSFAETGLQSTPWYNEHGANLFVRQLYLKAEPVDGVELSYGSLPILHGALTEAISYDDDGYIAGGRVVVSRPHQFFFDHIAATYAFIGDYYQPNYFRRLDRMTQSNYHQFLLQKNVNSRLTLSTDYTSHQGEDFIRGGVIVNTRGLFFLDKVHAGFYARANPDPGHGFEFSSERHIGKRTVFSAGYTSVDKGYSTLITPDELAKQRPVSNVYGYAPGGNLNGDRTTRGNRPFVNLQYTVNSVFKVNAYANESIHPDYLIKNGKVLLVELDCNLKPLLHRTGLVE